MSDQRTGPYPDSRKRVLVLCDYYLPSRKGGGGTWTVVNLIERLSARYDFFVITRNHESRNDLEPFGSVRAGMWNMIGPAKVHYLAPTDIKTATLAALTLEVNPDICFLNSVFSLPVRTFLRLRRRGLFKKIPVVLAPCGELSAGALGLKRWKKSAYLAVAGAAGLYRDIKWKATSHIEAEEIRNAFGNGADVAIAPDLPPREILPEFSLGNKPVKSPGSCKLIFYSRIDRKKNLHYLMHRLRRVTSGDIHLSVVGPEEHAGYAAKVRAAASDLPTSIELEFVGEVSYPEGLKLLTESHFFVLPTLGENFGYVILEALASGCPVLLSDRTIWKNVEKFGAGWTASLEQQKLWEELLDRCVDMGQAEYQRMSNNARQLAVDWLGRHEQEAQVTGIFESALSSNA